MRGGSEPRCNKKRCCLQEQTFDGLKPATRRLLARIPDEATATNSLKRRQIRKAQAGTILVREWPGSTHRITVLDDGIAFNGRRYRLLSEVAREITWESLGGTAVLRPEVRASSCMPRPSRNSRDIWRLNPELKLWCPGDGLSSDRRP
jgi:hypothetical protein